METIGHIEIESLGYYLPPEIIKTKDILAEISPERLDIEGNYIERQVGVSEVRYCESKYLPSDLAVIAAEKALSKTTINKDHIDLIIFCGIEGDYIEPSTAHIVQHKLGLKSSLCFDVQNACLGFMTALQAANGMIASGMVRYALLVTGEKNNILAKAAIQQLREVKSLKEFTDKVGYLTVGDAGGAILVGAKKDAGFINFVTSSFGEYSGLCYYRKDGAGRFDGNMVMGKICAVGLREHRRIYHQAISSVAWQPDDIDCLVSHQVGNRFFSELSKICSVPIQKMTRTYDYFGNLTTATLPVNLGIAQENSLIKKGTKIWAAMAGSGISVAHASMVV